MSHTKLRIRDLREDADLTQKQVAELLFCDQSLYSKYIFTLWFIYRVRIHRFRINRPEYRLMFFG